MLAQVEVEAVTAADAVLPGLMAVLAGLLVVWLIRSGRLGVSALAGRPERRVGLTPIDAVAGVLLLFGGQVVAASVLAAVEGVSLAGRVLLSQVVGMGPACAWFWGRCATSRFLAPISVEAGPALPLDAMRGGLRDAGVLPRDLPAEARSGVWAAGACLLLSGAVLGVLTLMNQWVTGEAPGTNHGLLDQFINQKGAALAGLLLSTVVLAPLFEETLFRGLFQTSLLGAVGWGAARRWCVIVGVAVAFSAIHYGSVSWQALPALAVLGVVFGWLYERTGSLWPGLVAHAVFNGVNVVMHIVFTAFGDV